VSCNLRDHEITRSLESDSAMCYTGLDPLQLKTHEGAETEAERRTNELLPSQRGPNV
jgi:hypothetical protein